jgi:hypothetical protein
MYAPINGLEWVEIYNPTQESINLTNWQLHDIKAKDKIICCKNQNQTSNLCNLQMPANEYKIITDQDSFLELSKTIPSNKIICVDDNSIGNSLSNKKDTITITNSSYKTKITYNKKTGGYLNNKTIELSKSNSFHESKENYGTPTQQNSVWNLAKDYSKLIITEVMANPSGEDNNPKPLGEWIEIYNNGNDPIELKELYFTNKNKQKLIIANDKVDSTTIICSKCYATIYRNSKTTFNLNNIYDNIKLFHEDNLLDQMTYSGAKEENTISLTNNKWIISSIPTPNQKNIPTDKCDWKLQINSNNKFIEEKNEIELTVTRNYGDSELVNVSGFIEDINGKIIKEYKPFTNTKISKSKTKTYSPRLKEGIYQATFKIDSTNCQDQVTSNNKQSVTIAKNIEYKKDETKIQIERIYEGNDHKIHWGDNFNVKIIVYKGDETKNTLSLYIEQDNKKISKTTKFQLVKQYEEFDLTLPIQLDLKCSKSSIQKANLVLQGLSKKEEIEIQIHPNLKNCKDSIQIPTKETKPTLIDESTNNNQFQSNSNQETQKTKSNQELNLNLNSNNDYNNFQNLNLSQKKEFIEKKFSTPGFTSYQSSSKKPIEYLPFMVIFAFILLTIVILKNK